MVCFRRKEDRRKRYSRKMEIERSNNIGSGKIKYLGYILKTSGGEKGQIKELKKNGNVVLKQV